MPIITIKFDPTRMKMRAYGDDGKHGELLCQFPNQLRIEGARYRVERLEYVDDGNRKPFYRPFGITTTPLNPAQKEDALKIYINWLDQHPDFEVFYKGGDVNDFFGDDYCACSVIVIYKENQQQLFRMDRIVGEDIKTYKFFVDISAGKGDEYSRSAIITSTPQFGQILVSTVEVLLGFNDPVIRDSARILEHGWNNLV